MFRYILFVLLILNFTSLSAFNRDERLDPTPLYARRLVSDAEHLDFLKNTLRTAQSSVMISTYSVSPDRVFNDGIGQAIIAAAARGVKVYIYYENQRRGSREAYAAIRRVASRCARFEQNANHSKCLTKDGDTVGTVGTVGTAAIGSYNWLGDSYENSSNASIVVSGLLASGLINDVWQGIRFYQSLEYGNQRGIRSFLSDRDAFSTGEYQFSPGQFFYTLRTPEAHVTFLDEVFAKARQRVILFSPFIRLANLQGIFTPQMLRGLHQRGVTVKLVTQSSPCDRAPEEQEPIFAFLNGLSSAHPNFFFMRADNCHAKSVIADSDVICEGSRNWLSAVNDLAHAANNCEMSVAVRGSIAQAIIQAFQRTEFGRSVLEDRRNEVTQRPRVVREEIPNQFDDSIEIFPGARWRKAGFCVRFKGGDYIRTDNKIVYFGTVDEARRTAYAIWTNRS